MKAKRYADLIAQLEATSQRGDYPAIIERFEQDAERRALLHARRSLSESAKRIDAAMPKRERVMRKCLEGIYFSVARIDRLARGKT